MSINDEHPMNNINEALTPMTQPPPPYHNTTTNNYHSHHKHENQIENYDKSPSASAASQLPLQASISDSKTYLTKKQQQIELLRKQQHQEQVTYEDDVL